MKLPQIKFREMSLQENIDIIKWTFYNGNGPLSVHNYTIEYFKELSSFSNKTKKEEVYKKIEEVVTKEYNKYKDDIKKSCQKIQWPLEKI